VTDPAFEPVLRAFHRLMGRGAGGGALVVRLRGRTVVDVRTGTVDRARRRPWTRDTMAISFSTTKGVTATVIHRLAERGLLAYDEPVATHWPEFATGGKDRLTVRELLSHRAGLHDLRPIARRAEDVLDHLAMEERLAARTVRSPTAHSAYHALTFGWLCAGLARRVTGKGMAQLVQEEVAAPLGVRSLHIGAPAGSEADVGEPVGDALRQAGSAARVLSPVWSRLGRTRTTIDALLVPGFHRLFEGPEPPIWRTEMPAVNGVLGADSLARLYGALANAGADDGRRLLAPETVDALGRVQVRSRDQVLGIPMRWRLGYHQAFGLGREASRGFGHYGYGGSGGWADPSLGLSLGFVTNRIGSVSTPLGDFTLFRLSGLVRECAARATGHW
jgi:CubicO group peptidase (beta-lactamase class C family)